MKKYVYSFIDGHADGSSKMKNLLGGKGANLAEMTNLKIPVPPGITITTEVCTYFMKHNRFPKGLKFQVLQAIQKIENYMHKKFADANNPLLLSVSSGARQSMPGMIETVLNIGLSPLTIEGMIKSTNNPKFVYDSYRRLIMMYADVVIEKTNDSFNNINIRMTLEDLLHDLKKKLNYKNDI